MGRLTFALLASAVGACGLAACSTFTSSDSPAPVDDGGPLPDALFADASGDTSADDASPPTSHYEALVEGAHPLHYFRFGAVAPNATALDNGSNTPLFVASYNASVASGPSALPLDTSDTSLAIRELACVTSMGDSGLNISSGTFTLEAWVRPLTDGVSGGIISDNSTGPVNPVGYVLELLSTGLIQMTLFTPNPVNGQGLTSMKKVEAGVWKHVVFVAQASTIDLYLDGNIDATASVIGSPAWESPGRLAIGSTDGCDPDGNFLSGGMIDEVALYNVALSPTQIAAHYAEGVRTR